MFNQVFCFPKQKFLLKMFLSHPRASKNDFGHFSIVFLEIESWITELSCNYPTRMEKFISCFSNIQMKFIDGSRFLPMLIQGQLSQIRRQQTIDDCNCCLLKILRICGWQFCLNYAQRVCLCVLTFPKENQELFTLFKLPIVFRGNFNI